MKTNPNPARLDFFCACEAGLEHAARFDSLREWWLNTREGYYMWWLIGNALEFEGIDREMHYRRDERGVLLAAAEMSDLLRERLTIDAVCAVLELDPDQGVY
jgi:hypothetical protein